MSAEGMKLEPSSPHPVYNQKQTLGNIMTITFDPLQQEAIDECCDIANRLVCVTGPAGTGKTLLLKTVYEQLTAHGYRVALCSPTGKAAKRIFESTGIPASTIHRLLEFTHPGEIDPKTGKPEGISVPRRTRSNPLDFDVVLADEYAMVNQEVHRSLLEALPTGAVVRMFGDDNQLAPIEEYQKRGEKAGPSAFQEMLRNPKLKSVKLEVVFRQGADSGILMNATNLLRSRMPVKNDQWSQHITDQPVEALTDYIMEMLEEGVDFSSTQHQIIVPQRVKSWVGCDKLNPLIQGMFFNETESTSPTYMMVPRKDTWSAGSSRPSPDIRMFEGDKVIFNSNNPDLGIFNGEVGKIIELDPDVGAIIVDFGDREQEIPPMQEVLNRFGKTSTIDPRKDLDLAYAITTHKCQGSEYSHVVYILNKSNLFMINRRNFYTAVTRAKEHVHLIADQKGLSAGVYKRD